LGFFSKPKLITRVVRVSRVTHWRVFGTEAAVALTGAYRDGRGDFQVQISQSKTQRAKCYLSTLYA
jgi:hypothetical protein